MAESLSGCVSSSCSDWSEPFRLLIVGLGNPLMADDGIGHEVVRRLALCDLPNHVRLAAIDGDVLSLTRVWKGEHQVWFVDAVSGDAAPGTRYDFEHQDLLGLPARGLSVHHPSIGESLRWMLHAQPEMAAIEFRLYGIEAGAIRPQRALTQAVEDAVVRIVSELQTAVRNCTPFRSNPAS